MELDERIKDTKEQSQNEITKLEKRVEVIEKLKPLQLSTKIATFTADKVLSKNLVNTFNIFDINEKTFKLKELDNKIIIDNDNFIRF